MTAAVQGQTYDIPDMWIAGFTLGGRSVAEAVECWHEQASEDAWRELADEQQDTLPCLEGKRHDWKATCRTHTGYGYRREVALELTDWFVPADSGTHGKTFTCAHCRQSVFVGTTRQARTVANVSPYAGRNAKEAKREVVPPTFRFTPHGTAAEMIAAGMETHGPESWRTQSYREVARKLAQITKLTAPTIHDREG